MHETYKAKQEWLKRVKKSKMFNHATKTFAWCVMDHMYGDKTVSHPGGALIKSETNIATNKQGAHRKALGDAGALTCVLIKNDKGDWDSYEYTLNLDWEEATPDKGSTPQGNTLPPTGVDGPPHRGTGVYPTGETNLSSQSIKESENESIKTTTNAGAPVVDTLPNREIKEEYKDAKPLLTTSSRNAAQVAENQRIQENVDIWHLMDSEMEKVS